MEYESCGFFIDYNRALKYAKKYMQTYELKCWISKQLIVATDADEMYVIRGEEIQIWVLRRKNTVHMTVLR